MTEGEGDSNLKLSERCLRVIPSRPELPRVPADEWLSRYKWLGLAQLFIDERDFDITFNSHKSGFSSVYTQRVPPISKSTPNSESHTSVVSNRQQDHLMAVLQSLNRLIDSYTWCVAQQDQMSSIHFSRLTRQRHPSNKHWRCKG